MATGWAKNIATLGRFGGGLLRVTLGRVLPGMSSKPELKLPLSATVRDASPLFASVTDANDYRATVSEGTL